VIGLDQWLVFVNARGDDLHHSPAAREPTFHDQSFLSEILLELHDCSGILKQQYMMPEMPNKTALKYIASLAQCLYPSVFMPQLALQIKTSKNATSVRNVLVGLLTAEASSD
jgi:hypothetical protein